jgi:DNA-binding NtrC family response regulator
MWLTGWHRWLKEGYWFSSQEAMKITIIDYWMDMMDGITLLYPSQQTDKQTKVTYEK